MKDSHSTETTDEVQAIVLSEKKSRKRKRSKPPAIRNTSSVNTKKRKNDSSNNGNQTKKRKLNAAKKMSTIKTEQKRTSILKNIVKEGILKAISLENGYLTLSVSKKLGIDNISVNRCLYGIQKKFSTWFKPPTTNNCSPMLALQDGDSFSNAQEALNQLITAIQHKTPRNFVNVLKMIAHEDVLQPSSLKKGCLTLYPSKGSKVTTVQINRCLYNNRDKFSKWFFPPPQKSKNPPQLTLQKGVSFSDAQAAFDQLIAALQGKFNRKQKVLEKLFEKDTVQTMSIKNGCLHLSISPESGLTNTKVRYCFNRHYSKISNWFEKPILNDEPLQLTIKQNINFSDAKMAFAQLKVAMQGKVDKKQDIFETLIKDGVLKPVSLKHGYLELAILPESGITNMQANNGLYNQRKKFSKWFKSPSKTDNPPQLALREELSFQNAQAAFEQLMTSLKEKPQKKQKRARVLEMIVEEEILQVKSMKNRCLILSISDNSDVTNKQVNNCLYEHREIFAQWFQPPSRNDESPRLVLQKNITFPNSQAAINQLLYVIRKKIDNKSVNVYEKIVEKGTFKAIDLKDDCLTLAISELSGITICQVYDCLHNQKKKFSDHFQPPTKRVMPLRLNLQNGASFKNAQAALEQLLIDLSKNTDRKQLNVLELLIKEKALQAISLNNNCLKLFVLPELNLTNMQANNCLYRLREVFFKWFEPPITNNNPPQLFLQKGISFPDAQTALTQLLLALREKATSKKVNVLDMLLEEGTLKADSLKDGYFVLSISEKSTLTNIQANECLYNKSCGFSRWFKAPSKNNKAPKLALQPGTSFRNAKEALRCLKYLLTPTKSNMKRLLTRESILEEDALKANALKNGYLSLSVSPESGLTNIKATACLYRQRRKFSKWFKPPSTTYKEPRLFLQKDVAFTNAQEAFDCLIAALKGGPQMNASESDTEVDPFESDDDIDACIYELFGLRTQQNTDTSPTITADKYISPNIPPSSIFSQEEYGNKRPSKKAKYSEVEKPSPLPHFKDNLLESNSTFFSHKTGLMETVDPLIHNTSPKP